MSERKQKFSNSSRTMPQIWHLCPQTSTVPITLQPSQRAEPVAAPQAASWGGIPAQLDAGWDGALVKTAV